MNIRDVFWSSADGLERGLRQSQVHMFLLTDLYAGIVYYEQNDYRNKEPRSDFFWFHITDGENSSPVNRFNITIIVSVDLILCEVMSIYDNHQCASCS